MIRWGSIITSPDGEIDPLKLKTFVSIILGLCGGVVMIGTAIIEVTMSKDIPLTAMLAMAGVLVAPITGGMIMAGKALATRQQETNAVIIGNAPDRRYPPEPPAV